eukprot:TRINITY_DN33109_c0_g1_i1.p1 TRINITY_DN33109_c0_g1~~TRINITY_DN33109_c0_g1_i1.p1  ORF type:complete len:151 (+),score=25.20 TRINITY_DN33109_c0_g1_i1:118-570(+)
MVAQHLGSMVSSLDAPSRPSNSRRRRPWIQPQQPRVRETDHCPDRTLLGGIRRTWIVILVVTIYVAVTVTSIVVAYSRAAEKVGVVPEATYDGTYDRFEFKKDLRGVLACGLGALACIKMPARAENDRDHTGPAGTSFEEMKKQLFAYVF